MKKAGSMGKIPDLQKMILSFQIANCDLPLFLVQLL